MNNSPIDIRSRLLGHSEDENQVQDEELTLETLVQSVIQTGGMAELPTLPFRLRKYCPYAVDYLKNKVRIPLKHRRQMEEFLDDGSPSRNLRHFYSRLLDYLEDDTTRFSYLLTEVQLQITKDSQHGKRRRSYSSPFVELAIKVNKSAYKLEEHVSRFGTVENITTRDKVGLFFWYAIVKSVESNNREIEGDPSIEVDDSHLELLWDKWEETLASKAPMALKFLNKHYEFAGSVSEFREFTKGLSLFSSALEKSTDVRLIAGAESLMAAAWNWWQVYNERFSERLVNCFGDQFCDFFAGPNLYDELESLMASMGSAISERDRLAEQLEGLERNKGLAIDNGTYSNDSDISQKINAVRLALIALEVRIEGIGARAEEYLYFR